MKKRLGKAIAATALVLSIGALGAPSASAANGGDGVNGGGNCSWIGWFDASGYHLVFYC